MAIPDCTGIILYSVTAVTLRAYDTTGTLTHTVTDQLLSLTLHYGSLGTGQSAEVVLAQDLGWDTSTHRVAVVVTSEHGANEQVFVGWVQQSIAVPGQPVRVQLGGMYDLSKQGRSTLISVVVYGGAYSTDQGKQLDAAIRAGMTGDNLDVGATPNGTLVAGYPSSANRLTIPLDSPVAAWGGALLKPIRPGFRSQGRRFAQNYLTEWAATNELGTYTGSRSVGPYVPKVLGTGQIGQNTTSQAVTFSTSGSSGTFDLVYDGTTHGVFQTYVSNIGLTAQQRNDGGTLYLGATMVDSTLNGDWIADLTITGGLLPAHSSQGGKGAGVAVFAITVPPNWQGNISATLNVSISKNAASSSHVQGTFLVPSGTFQQRSLQAMGSVTGLEGMNRNPVQAASYDFTLPNCLCIPPFSVVTPAGAQDVAGAVWQWDRKNHNTTLTTSALPSGVPAEYNPGRFGDQKVGQMWVQQRRTLN